MIKPINFSNNKQMPWAFSNHFSYFSGTCSCFYVE